MRIDAISSYSIANGLRASTAALQTRLAELQLEITTGQHADLGLEVGNQTRSVVSFENDISFLERQIDTNQLIATRASVSQTAMAGIVTISDELVSTLTLVGSDQLQSNTAITSAESTLEQLTSFLNMQADGNYVFGGQRTDTPPLEDYIGGPAQTVFRDAFQIQFGFAVTDPAAASITEAQITDFITNVAEPLFSGAGWTANVSQASSDRIETRIADGTTITTSVTANEEAFQDIMFGAIIAYESYSMGLSGEALSAASEDALSRVSSGVNRVSELQGTMGVVEQRLADINSRHQDQINLFTGFVSDIRAVDPYEASSELSSLLTQVQISYTITSRIQQLTLANFIR